MTCFYLTFLIYLFILFIHLPILFIYSYLFIYLSLFSFFCVCVLSDGNNNEEWAMSLQSDDFKLLCPSYGSANRAAVSEFRTCNLALVPAHEVRK